MKQDIQELGLLAAPDRSIRWSIGISKIDYKIDYDISSHLALATWPY